MEVKYGKGFKPIVGVVCLVLGVVGIIVWRVYFLKGLMAAVPAILIIVGAIALFAGISEIKDSLASKKEEAAKEEKPEEKKEEDKKE